MEGENTADKLIVKFKGSALIYESGLALKKYIKRQKTPFAQRSL